MGISLEVGDAEWIGFLMAPCESEKVLGQVDTRHRSTPAAQVPRLAALPARDGAHLLTLDDADEILEGGIGECRASADPRVVLDRYVIVCRLDVHEASCSTVEETVARTAPQGRRADERCGVDEGRPGPDCARSCIASWRWLREGSRNSAV